MIWEKRGLLLEPDKSLWWSKNYCMVPTPLLLEKERRIRIFYASTDQENNSRVSFIDVDATDPSLILHKEEEPILDLGALGTFDANGVNVCSILTVSNVTYLYYVGYQRFNSPPYKLYTGLATAKNKSTFTRVSDQPLLQQKEVSVSNGAPFVIIENGVWKMWFWYAKKWVNYGGKDYLNCCIGYAESDNGISWSIHDKPCIVPNEEEFSIARPWVVKSSEGYLMWYSRRHKKKLYQIGLAKSEDGLEWTRIDDQVGIGVSESGWDSQMVCYASVIPVEGKTFMFYNGNENGKTGFGYAELVG